MMRNHGIHGFRYYSVRYGLACKKNACVLSIRQKTKLIIVILSLKIFFKNNNNVLTFVRFYLLDNRNPLFLL